MQFVAQSRCSDAWVDLTSELLAERPAKALVHAQQKAWLREMRVHQPVPIAFACGIPASTPLSVLDRDKAYIYSDACTVYPSTINYLEVRRENCGGSKLEVGTNLLVDPFHLCPLSIRACRLRRHISIPGEIRIPAIRHHRFLRVPRSVFHAGLPW